MPQGWTHAEHQTVWLGSGFCEASGLQAFHLGSSGGSEGARAVLGEVGGVREQDQGRAQAGRAVSAENHSAEDWTLPCGSWRR